MNAAAYARVSTDKQDLEVNKAGGVLGRPLELLVRDSALKTDLGISAARELVVNENVNFLFGSISSAVRLAISDVAKQYKVPMIDSIGGSRRLVEDRGHDYFFELSLTTRTEAYGQAVGVSKIKGKKIVTISPDYEWGRLEHEGFVQPLKKFRPDVEVVGEFWPKLGEKDFTPYITALLAKNPDIIWSGLWGGDFIAFVKQAKPYGIFERFAFVGTGEPSAIQAVGQDAPEGTYAWDRAPVYAIDTPAMTAFVSAYRAKNGRIPTAWVVFGYEAVQLVKYGLEKAGTEKPEAWVRAVKGATVPLLRGPITFREFDNVSNSLIGLGAATGLGLWFLLARTRLGKIIRAAVADREMVGILGIRLPRLFATVFGIGAFLAGAAGLLAAPLGSIGTGMDVEIIVAVFAVVIVGGMGSFLGAALASLIIGEVYTFGILILPQAAQVFMFLVMVLVLIVRPQGLLGAAER